MLLKTYWGVTPFEACVVISLKLCGSLAPPQGVGGSFTNELAFLCLLFVQMVKYVYALSGFVSTY